MNDDIKKEIWSYFQKTQVIYLSTIDKIFPRVRPVTLVYLDDRFWVATGAGDAKVIQIKNNDNVEFCLSITDGKENGYIRVAGKAIFITNRDERKYIFDAIPYLKKFWKDANDPEFALLEIKPQEIEYLKIGEYLAEKFQMQ